MCHFFCIFMVKLPVMLSVQSTLAFSDYSSLYDLLVPKTNLLRQINNLVDFSFVRKELLANILSGQRAYGRMFHSYVQISSSEDYL